MIPKIIHYCWFGGAKKSKLIQKCMQSWRKFCPDYEIKEWNETNFDVHCCKYVEDAYAAKKWAFIADYFRFWVVANHGGIYFDTDIRVYKSFDEFLDCDFFCGYETDEWLEPAIIGGVAHNSVSDTFIQTYETKLFVLDGKQDLTPLPITFTNHFKNTFSFNLDATVTENNDGIVIFAKPIFRPDRSKRNAPIITKDTAAMHCYSGSWVDKKSKRRLKIYNILCRFFGVKFADKIRNKFGREG
ncbi:glycosyltransferase family 32 protein [Pumilibacter intestinalis]|uniref:glycosyltransferase family 32 protein n=1 Tax=Pumilibacter intestinalis TaxID=2941511 RepID=UPI002040E9F7|nr:glycosyltransferase [Pumilibacter intestinalis]